MSTTLVANPAKMIAKGAPHVIHNDEELEAATTACRDSRGGLARKS